MRIGYLLLIVVLFAACKQGRKVNTSFYYWKTVYKQNKVENAYLQHLHSNKLYVRMMDVDMGEDGVDPVPVSPIIFQDKLADTLQLVPVVFIVNDILRNASHPQLNNLANKILAFVNGKVSQAGKKNYNELQIDCDWTAETRENYFYLLGQIKPLLGNRQLSVTLRLHQIKNQKTSGIPPADKVLLMCYNMGNLRKYGTQNSIIELSELKKYIGDNLTAYPMTMDIGLPLFSWAVAFRNKQYIGIDKRINFNILNDQNQFVSNGNDLYSAKTDLPAYGLQKGDEVRWENAGIKDVQATTAYIARFLKPGDVNVIYFHLDEAVVKKYTYEELENTANLLR
jgi:hypothetical protein